MELWVGTLLQSSSAPTIGRMCKSSLLYTRYSLNAQLQGAGNALCLQRNSSYISQDESKSGTGAQDSTISLL